MAWVESVSPSFRARHESRDADDADRVLHSLELTRDRLERVFPRTVGEITVVLHTSTVGVSLTNPLLPLGWVATDPAARRYVAGWAGAHEIHVLAPSALAGRASNVPGSREMLDRAPAALYTRRVIQENNHDLPRRLTPRRIGLELRWAWLLEGAARWFSGQTEHARPAIARRLHDGGRPSFPPGLRDAALLGGTVIDLLVREEGERRAVQLACRLHPQGSRAALSKAFGGRALVHTEGAWRSHLARLAGGR
ncbi:MAG TPA: hypothetical protein VG295_01825 [Solirubrobacteraceae bacterium]|jgi:hypothetical protein|nr:hypothetical protein [Solirubrobacteraceae bacterium]